MKQEVLKAIKKKLVNWQYLKELETYNFVQQVNLDKCQIKRQTEKKI